MKRARGLMNPTTMAVFQAYRANPNATLEQVARGIGVTRERVRQILGKYLAGVLDNPVEIRRDRRKEVAPKPEKEAVVPADLTRILWAHGLAGQPIPRTRGHRSAAEVHGKRVWLLNTTRAIFTTDKSLVEYARFSLRGGLMDCDFLLLHADCPGYAPRSWVIPAHEIDAAPGIAKAIYMPLSIPKWSWSEQSTGRRLAKYAEAWHLLKP